MSSNLELFRKDYLNANTWAQRKDGVPLDLLDNLTEEERKIAEQELLQAASLTDSWSIMGLGHLKSHTALPKLYELLSQSKKSQKIIIAHTIYLICGDKEMMETALAEFANLTGEYELIDCMNMLLTFKDERAENMLKAYSEHENYLVAYNATRLLGLPTDKVVEKFRSK